MPFSDDIFEWVLLLTRWLHVTVGITWIGTSIFFMWLERSLERSAALPAGQIGDLWMVHGGGFFHVEKHQMEMTGIPEHLHWFKWESYWTFISGIFLLYLMFYASGGALLLNSDVADVTYLKATVIGISSVVVSWFFYDLFWELRLAKTNPLFGNSVTLVWLVVVTYLLCKTLSGRAAYMHVGAILGAWMTGNVFLRIIPRQVKMVAAVRRGVPVNQDWSNNAKNRSTHNTYLTLPILFLMVSNHFPSTYGSTYNWLILLLVSTAGMCIRHFFIIRLLNPTSAKAVLTAGIVILAGTIYLSIGVS